MITQILHGIGFGILWFLGLITFPIISMIVVGYITEFEDDTWGGIGFAGGIALYLIGSALFLITR